MIFKQFIMKKGTKRACPHIHGYSSGRMRTTKWENNSEVGLYFEGRDFS